MSFGREGTYWWGCAAQRPPERATFREGTSVSRIKREEIVADAGSLAIGKGGQVQQGV